MYVYILLIFYIYRYLIRIFACIIQSHPDIYSDAHCILMNSKVKAN